MTKKPSNVIRIGLIDMLSAFLVSSIVLMLIIAFNMPVAGDIAGYPRDFVRLEFMVIKASNSSDELAFRKGARFRFEITTPEGEQIYNEIIRGYPKKDDNGNFELLNKQGKKHNALQLWGPTFKKEEGSMNTDTLYYVMYGVTSADNVGEWSFRATYFDNELLSDINFQFNNEAGRYIDQRVLVNARWEYLGGSYQNAPFYLQLGDSKEYKIE